MTKNEEKVLDLIRRHTIKVDSIEKINDKTINIKIKNNEIR